MSDLSTYLFAFLVGGAFCAAAQLLIDRTMLTPARILVLYVSAGVLRDPAALRLRRVDRPRHEKRRRRVRRARYLQGRLHRRGRRHLGGADLRLSRGAALPRPAEEIAACKRTALPRLTEPRRPVRISTEKGG